MSRVKKYVQMGDWLAVKASGGDAGRRPVSETFGRPTSSMSANLSARIDRVNSRLAQRRARALRNSSRADRLRPCLWRPGRMHDGSAASAA